MGERKLTSEEFEERIIDWVTYYRRNLHRFVEHYLGIELHLYQIILIYLMNLVPLVVIVAARAAAKSWIVAIYSVSRCILYPNSKVVIASGTKGQSGLIIKEKIKKELMNISATLRAEIKDIRTGQNESEVIFFNGSSITVVAASDTSRGYRATVLIAEEFRLIKKEVLDTVLSPFLYIRQAPYLNKPEYSHLGEEPIEIYISSAYFASHWMSQMIKLSVMDMFNRSEAVFAAMDFSVCLKHNIRTKKQLIKEKKKLGSLAFAMEYENQMVGQGEGAFYPFDLMEKTQLLKKSFYPNGFVDLFDNKKNKFEIKKQAGEIRVVAVDIAIMNREVNDNTVITCIRALPSGDYYERQVPYIEAFKGDNTDIQACRIKEIFYDFQADYIVLDCQSSGMGVYDSLGKITYSEVRDVEYPAFTSFNDKDMAARIKNKDAKPVIFAFKGQSEINQQMHYAMRDVLDKGRLKLLLNVPMAKDYLDTREFYLKATNIDSIAKYELPYYQTDLLINEMISLNQVIKGKYLILEEPSTGTKDRYVSLAMGNYLIKILELELQEEEDDDTGWDAMPITVSEIQFTL